MHVLRCILKKKRESSEVVHSFQFNNDFDLVSKKDDS